jgi:hypothetical protein
MLLSHVMCLVCVVFFLIYVAQCFNTWITYWLANYSLAMFIPDDEPYCARNMSK